MPFNIHCPSCRAKIKAPEGLIGRQVKCPGCGHPMIIQASAASAASLPAQPPAPRTVVPPLPSEITAPKPQAVPPMEIPSKPKSPKPPPTPVQLDELEEVEDDEEVDEGAVVEVVEEVEEVEEVEVAEADEGILTEEDVEVVEDEGDDDYGDRPRRKKKGEEPGRRGSPRKEERTTAMLIHLLSIFNFLIIPLIVWLVLWLNKRTESRFIDHHGKEALNLLITLFIGGLILGIAGFVLVGVMLSSQLGGGAVLSSVILDVVMVLLSLFGLVTTIIACIQANGGKWYRHPAIMHLLK
jgi:uncharacterized Tic20 family protein